MYLEHVSSLNFTEQNNEAARPFLKYSNVQERQGTEDEALNGLGEELAFVLDIIKEW